MWHNPTDAYNFEQHWDCLYKKLFYIFKISESELEVKKQSTYSGHKLIHFLEAAFHCGIMDNAKSGLELLF